MDIALVPACQTKSDDDDDDDIYLWIITKHSAHLKTNKVGLNDTSISNDINVHEI